jgi:hypothetical protein
MHVEHFEAHQQMQMNAEFIAGFANAYRVAVSTQTDNWQWVAK